LIITFLKSFVKVALKNIYTFFPVVSGICHPQTISSPLLTEIPVVFYRKSEVSSHSL